MKEELNDRETELRIKGHLYEIMEVNDDVIGGQQGFHMAEQGYIKTLINVADCADPDAVDEVARYIKEHIRKTEERPANRKVRRTARTVVTEAGYPANRYLNSA